MAERVSAELRILVSQRAQGRCEYCRCPASHSTQTFSVEHIIPRARGGTTTEDNLALACQGCNNHKYSRTTAIDPVTGEHVPLYHPRNDVWAEHFTWNEDCTLLIGLSTSGRATIEALLLNRAGVVNLRQLLFAAGLHPSLENG
jgi:HNH endonuclease